MARAKVKIGDEVVATLEETTIDIKSDNAPVLSKQVFKGEAYFSATPGEYEFLMKAYLKTKDAYHFKGEGFTMRVYTKEDLKIETGYKNGEEVLVRMKW